MLRVVLLFVLIGLVTANSLISLDMGTEFMKIGIVKPGVPIDIVLNTESKRKTPMVVYIKDDERLFGDSAKTRGMKSPKNAYTNLFDLLGKKVDNPVVKEYIERFPYHEIEAHPEQGTVVFRHDSSTTYTVEELLAMIVEHAVQLATIHGEAPVTKVVISVPPFFNQRERQALLGVAEIANVQVMQLMSCTSAIALQYAVFRNIKMEEKPMIVVFATVGSQFTTAAVVSFSLQKDKTTKKTAETVQVLGVGYDRSLGGYEMDIRLRDHLAAKFTEKYPKLPDVRKNKRAMQKLLKEANKVKTVLSANMDTVAQVESLHEDKDFRLRMSRDIMEGLFTDLYPRFAAPFEEAITSSGISKIEIEQVVLFGGATRVPKIQEQIKAVTGAKELHKYINTDEAAAMGSAFRAASASSVFRTKEIKLKDANHFPFFVAFNKISLNEEGDIVDMKLVNKELYYRNNGIPQKKAMTYTKFTQDFHFNVSYGNLEFLSENQISEFGELPVMRVNVKGVADVFNLHHDKTSKGIKAHIAVDESGMIAVDSIEAIFETIVPEVPEEGWMDSVSSFFGSKEEVEKAAEGSDTEKTEEKKEENKEEKKDEKKETTEESKGEKTEDKKEDVKEEPKEVIPEKPVIIREDLKAEIVLFGIPWVTDLTVNKEKLAALTKVDDDKRATEQARNNLESFVINMKDLMTTDEYMGAATPEELEKITHSLREETDWIEEESWGETHPVFNARLAKIEDYCDPVMDRVKETAGRAAAIADLKQAFNLTEQFLAKMANTSDELRYHTVVEIDNLQKLYDTTKLWLEATTSEQAELATNVDPLLKIADLGSKQRALERDLYYLIRKPIPQWYRDKITKMMEAMKNSTKTANKTSDAKAKTDGDSETTDAKTEDTTPASDTPETGDKKEETTAETPASGDVPTEGSAEEPLQIEVEEPKSEQSNESEEKLEL